MDQTTEPTEELSEEILGVARIFRITASVKLVAANAVEAQERFDQLREWLNDLHMRSHRGLRFAYWLGNPLREAESWAVEHSDAVGVPFECHYSLYHVATTSIDLVAVDESLARARFDGLRDWLKALADRRHSRLGYVVGGTLGEARSVQFVKDDEIASSDTEFTFRHAHSWFDENDRGQLEDCDVDAVFMWDADDRLRYQTDEQTDAVEALKLVAHLLPTVERDPLVWKWIIIALHNAVQGFMVLALQGTWNVRVRKRDPKTGEVTDKLMDFLELYERIKKDKFMAQFVHSRTFVPEPRHTRSVKRLNHLRNNFVHFVPMDWNVHMDEWPKMVDDCADIIFFLAFLSNNVQWELREELQEQTAELIAQVWDEAIRIADVYADEAEIFMGKEKAAKLRLRKKKRSARNAPAR